MNINQLQRMQAIWTLGIATGGFYILLVGVGLLLSGKVDDHARKYWRD
ncbi:hypothetical protein [Klebsiella indica]|nr:hypothetical protein [Klebsiella indica]